MKSGTISLPPSCKSCTRLIGVGLVLVFFWFGAFVDVFQFTIGARAASLVNTAEGKQAEISKSVRVYCVVVFVFRYYCIVRLFPVISLFHCFLEHFCFVILTTGTNRFSSNLQCLFNRNPLSTVGEN